MRHCKEVLVLSLLIFAFPCSAFAHGVQGKVHPGGVVVTAQYDSGEPMSYAKVKIWAPEGKLLFQSGRTDRNGRFSFFPDVAGNWKVVVDDEMGHRLEMAVPVNEDLVLEKHQDSGGTGKSGFSRYEKALMGICIIFGLFGIFSWSKRKKGEPAS